MWILMIYPSQALKISQTFEKKSQTWKRKVVGEGPIDMHIVVDIEKLDSSFQLLDNSNLPFQPHVRRLMRSLKKFEMRIDIPNAIRLNRKRFEANICARYLIWNKEVIIFLSEPKTRIALIENRTFVSLNGNMTNMSTPGYWHILIISDLCWTSGWEVKRPGKYGNIAFN